MVFLAEKYLLVGFGLMAPPHHRERERKKSIALRLCVVAGKKCSDFSIAEICSSTFLLIVNLIAATEVSCTVAPDTVKESSTQIQAEASASG